MSTRAHITIRQKDVVLHMSHHCDGYPSGVGSDLVDLLKSYAASLPDPHAWTAGGLWDYINKEDEDYHPVNSGVRWDQEYIYVIDCDQHTLKGYYKGITDPKGESDEYDDGYGDPLYISGNIFNYPGEFEKVLGYTKADDKKEEPKKAKASVIASFFESFGTNPAGSPRVLTEYERKQPSGIKLLMAAIILQGLQGQKFSSDEAMLQRAVNLSNKLCSMLEK